MWAWQTKGLAWSLVVDLTVKNSCFTLGGSSYMTAMIHSNAQSGISASMRLEPTLSYRSNSSSSLFHPKFPFIFFINLLRVSYLYLRMPTIPVK